MEDARRYDSDSLGSSVNWRARESLEGEEMDDIEERECRRVREREGKRTKEERKAAVVNTIHVKTLLRLLPHDTELMVSQCQKTRQ